MASDTSTRTPDGFLVFVGSAAMFVMVAGVFIATMSVTGAGGENLEQRRAARRNETRARLEREASEKLNSTGWVDKAKGTVHIAIKDAIPMVVAELKAKKQGVSQVKVEPPLPMPVADPNSKDPAPPALPSAPQGADTIRFTYPQAAEPTTPAPAAAPATAPAAAPSAPPSTAPAAKPPEVPAPAAPQTSPPPAATPAAAPAPAKPPSAPPASPTSQTGPTSPTPAAAPEPAAPAPPATDAPVPAPSAPAPAAPSRPPIINPTDTNELPK